MSRPPRIGAVVLAAGRSSRMGGSNKLLEPMGDAPVLAHVVDAAITAGAEPVVVVTGYRADDVVAALGARTVTLVANPRWADGMATSLSAGIHVLDGRVDGALICLGDMPGVIAEDLRALMTAFGSAFRDQVRKVGGEETRVRTSHATKGPTPAATGELPAAWIPVHEGRRGNPVLWSSSFFTSLRSLQGDRGAKGLLSELGDQVREVPAGPGVLVDVDTPEELDRARETRDASAQEPAPPTRKHDR